MGLGPSLLFLAPVLAMVGLVVVAKIRNNGEEDEFAMPGDPLAELDTSDFPALEEREPEPVS